MNQVLPKLSAKKEGKKSSMVRKNIPWKEKIFSMVKKIFHGKKIVFHGKKLSSMEKKLSSMERKIVPLHS